MRYSLLNIAFTNTVLIIFIEQKNFLYIYISGIRTNRLFYFLEAFVEAEVMADRILPAVGSSAKVWKIFTEKKKINSYRNCTTR